MVKDHQVPLTSQGLSKALHIIKNICQPEFLLREDRLQRFHGDVEAVDKVNDVPHDNKLMRHQQNADLHKRIPINLPTPVDLHH